MAIAVTPTVARNFLLIIPPCRISLPVRVEALASVDVNEFNTGPQIFKPKIGLREQELFWPQIQL